MTARGAASALTRATAFLATLFMLTSLALAIIATRGTSQAQPRSLLDQPATTAPAQPAAPSVPVAR